MRRPLLVVVLLLAAAPAATAVPGGLLPAAPRADFAFAPAVPEALEDVRFTSLSTGGAPLVLQRWRFAHAPDELGPFGPQVDRAFPRGGAYEVSLEVVDALGRRDVRTHVVQVMPAPPVASFDVTPTPAFRNAPVAFNDTSVDPDGDGIVAWAWSFGDGATAATRNATHAYADTGDHLVTLRVTDAAGRDAWKGVVLRVTNAPPVIEHAAVEPAVVHAGRTAWLNATARDPDGAPGAALAYTWTFSDGVTLEGANVSRTFARGANEAQVRATDADGGVSAPLVLRFDVDHAPPLADFSFAPGRPSTGDAISFADRSSGDAPIVAWWWNFGDGRASSASSPTHAYATHGRHVVILEVRDANNMTATVSRAIEVNARPAAAFNASPAHGARPGEPVAFTDRSTDADGHVVSWWWDMGDGTTSQARSPTHAYAMPGAYTVTLRVQDDAGATATASRIVHIVSG